MAIGREIRKGRVRLGLTQRECAIKLGLSRAAISKAERLDSGVHSDTLLALLRVGVLVMTDKGPKATAV